MNSPLPTRNISSSSQTYYKQPKLKYPQALNIKEKVQIYSFQVPFGKISLSKKIPVKKSEKKLVVYPGILKKNTNNVGSKWNNWIDQVFVNLPSINKQQKITFGKSDCEVGKSVRKAKVKNYSEDYGECLFREPGKLGENREENYSMHKTFNQVIEELKKREKVKKSENLSFFY